MQQADAELIAEFTIESQEGLSNIEQQMLAIEAGGAEVDLALVNSVFRTMHSIKGTAGFLGLDRIGTLAHGLEEVLNYMRNREIVPSSDLVSTVLHAADYMKGLIDAVENSNEADVSSFVESLQQFRPGAVPAVVPLATPPVTANYGSLGGKHINRDHMTDQNFYGNFHEAAAGVLKHLHARLGFNLWMVTRTEGDDWIVLEAADHGYGVKQGDVFRWADSFCSRMVEGFGPRIAPCSVEIPAYAAAPIGRQVPIGAYVGVPLNWSDGRLFGTMCAIHPEPRPTWITAELPSLELYARLLSSLLQSELKAAEQARAADRARVEAMTDQLTGLYNRRGWDQLVQAEEDRCRRYGHPACMISIDIDLLKLVNDTQGHAQGDLLLQQAARAITATIRASDVAARLGGDEFGVLGVECDMQGAQALMGRLHQEFIAIDVQASLGPR